MKTITCKVDEKLDAQLELLAQERRVSKSTIVRQALERTVTRSQKAKAVTAYDLVSRLCGCLNGPQDLSVNPKHLEDFGA